MFHDDTARVKEIPWDSYSYWFEYSWLLHWSRHCSCAHLRSKPTEYTGWKAYRLPRKITRHAYINVSLYNDCCIWYYTFVVWYIYAVRQTFGLGHFWWRYFKCRDGYRNCSFVFSCTFSNIHFFLEYGVVPSESLIQSHQNLTICSESHEQNNCRPFVQFSYPTQFCFLFLIFRFYSKNKDGIPRNNVHVEKNNLYVQIFFEISTFV